MSTFAQRKKVFVAKQKPGPRPPSHLLKVVGVVIGHPGDVLRLQMRRHSELVQPPLYNRMLDRLLGDFCSNTRHQIGVFAEQRVNRFRPVHVGRKIVRNRNLNPRWQRSEPFAKTPFAFPEAVLAGVHQCGFDFDTTLHPVLPLVPGKIPIEVWQKIAIYATSSLRRGSRQTTRSRKNSHRRSRSESFLGFISGL